MKIRSLLLALLFCSLLPALRAQGVKIKNGTVWVDGQEFVNITDETPTSFTLTSIESDSELVYLKLIDPTPNVSNADFDDRYFNLRFPDFDKEAIIKDSRKLSVIKFLYTHRIIVDGHISKSSFKSFITQYGIETTD